MPRNLISYSVSQLPDGVGWKVEYGEYDLFNKQTKYVNTEEDVKNWLDIKIDETRKGESAFLVKMLKEDRPKALKILEQNRKLLQKLVGEMDRLYKDIQGTYVSNVNKTIGKIEESIRLANSYTGG